MTTGEKGEKREKKEVRKFLFGDGWRRTFLLLLFLIWYISFCDYDQGRHDVMGMMLLGGNKCWISHTLIEKDLDIDMMWMSMSYTHYIIGD